MIKKLALAALTSLCVTTLYAQSVEEHVVTIGADPAPIENNHFKQGTNIDPKRVKLDLNNFYLRKGGKPIFPIMGEFHYSRYPRAEWEQALLQMKAAGIQIIALYNFWNHHEEEEGHFRFDDNRDVRYFLELCKKHDLQAVVRVGPWAHGEARNGGYPDWYVKKRLKNGFDRASTNGNIQPEVVTWYTKLAEQFKGLYYKDGGPIIGLQVDNEVRSTGPNSSGYQYMAALKQLAVKLGMDVPLYVVTGWPGPQVPEDEVLPLWGGYADAPWTQNIKELPANNMYQFVSDRRDKNIGNDVLKYDNADAMKPIYRHPFLTVEMGSGIQDAYLRRPVLDDKDVMAMMYTRLGVGANMLGYYVFHGTQHPLSWNKDYSTQESKSTIYPYPNDYPLISYDFQAPLGEWGYTNSYYNDLKLLHQFITDYGSTLAPMVSTVPNENPEKADDTQKLRYAVRSKGNSGFIFVNNYVRHVKQMANHPAVAFTIKTQGETIRIPDQGGLAIQNGMTAMLPFNLDAGGALIKYTTAHPTTIIGNTYFYYAQNGLPPVFKLDKKNIKNLEFKAGTVATDGNAIYLRDMKPGKACVVSVTLKTGKQVRLVTLGEREAKYSYVFKIKGQKTLLLTDSGKQAFYDEVTDQLTMRSIGDPSFHGYAYPSLRVKSKNQVTASSGIFSSYSIELKKAAPVNIPFKQVSDDKRFNQYVSTVTETPAKPNYGIHYVDTLPYKAYQLQMPKLPAGVYDELLDLNYNGNTAALYANGTIIADDYFTGRPMPFSLRRHEEKLGKDSFILQVSPLLQNPNIYFEGGVQPGFRLTTHAVLNSITARPVYQVVL